jgi:hypothetical protein
MNLAFNEPGNVARVLTRFHRTNPATLHQVGMVSTIYVGPGLLRMPTRGGQDLYFKAVGS